MSSPVWNKNEGWVGKYCATAYVKGSRNEELGLLRVDILPQSTEVDSFRVRYFLTQMFSEQGLGGKFPLCYLAVCHRGQFGEFDLCILNFCNRAMAFL